MTPLSKRLTHLSSALLGALLLLSGSANAVLLISDDFTGNSGSMPASWSYFGPFTSGTVVESGTNVGIDDAAGGGPTLLSPGTYNPQGATTTLNVDITSHSNDSAIFGIADATVTNIMVLQLRGTGDVVLFYSNTGAGAGTETVLTNLAGYSGGAMDMSFVFDDDSFSVLADGGSYNSGDTLYSSLSGGFSFAAFGSSVNLALGSSESLVSYDSVNFETTGSGLDSGGGGASAVPLPGSALLLMSGLITLRHVRKQRLSA